MKTHDIIGAIFLLILVFLLVNNSNESSEVIKSIGNTVTDAISTLQGRGN